MKILKNHLNLPIRLTDERLDHILEHPEMKGLQKELEKTLAEPEMIIRSRTDESVELYYRLLKKPRYGVKWLCTVVKSGVDDPFIITAYLTDRPKPGEQLWPKT